jgi:ubiquinone/menaquinone biosynthesis C-methylase UbiE
MTTGFRPGAVDYERQAPHFRKARGLSPAAAEVWRGVIQRHLMPLRPSVVLDLGSGTGRFSPLLADWLGAAVMGVEPSDAMRRSALRDAGHPLVAQIGGDAQYIPLAGQSCDAAWLAFVVHHVPDRTACARELARVLRPGGLALVVGAYTEARRDISLFRYFPMARRIVEAMPSDGEIIQQFTAGGLQHIGTEAVVTETTSGLAEAAARTALRADSALQLITDEEFAEGQRALEAAAAAETEPQPIFDTIDLLVFRRP